MEFFSRHGALIVNNQRFFLKGCSWFGGETDTRCPHGLWSHSVERYLDFLVQNRFNALRLPLAGELMLAFNDAHPTSINYDANRNLQGKTSGEVYDYVVAECAKRGIVVLLDMHCLTCKAGITPLWYTDEFPEEQLIHAWSMLVSRYQQAWNVIGADLKNEPWGNASWGDNNYATDWRLAAQRIGNAILNINPRLLIFVEGTAGNQHPKSSRYGAFWGGDMTSVRESPVHLCVPDKLVYSPHHYGPQIYMQEYFKDANFPKNMPDVWNEQWGHLLKQPKAGPAVVIGEWGGRFKNGTLESSWLDAYIPYLLHLGATDQFYWCLNPNSQDTGGLLDDDWTTPMDYKLQFLHKLCEHPSRIPVDQHGNPLISAAPFYPPSQGGASQQYSQAQTSQPPKSGWMQPIKNKVQSVFGRTSYVSAQQQQSRDAPPISWNQPTMQNAPPQNSWNQQQTQNAPSQSSWGQQAQNAPPQNSWDQQQGQSATLPGSSESMSVDASAVPGLYGRVGMINQWQDDQCGWECQKWTSGFSTGCDGGTLNEIDGKLLNATPAPLSGLQVEVIPPGKCLKVWNLKEIEPGRLYGLMDYTGANGGLRPQEELNWGGIFCSPYVKFVVSKQY